MTPLEREALDMLKIVVEFLTPPHKPTTQKDYMGLMGDLRDTIKHLDNSRYGCATGHHTYDCTCKRGLVGKALRKLY